MRRLLFLSLCLAGLTGQAYAAGEALFVFEYPVEWQARVSYIAHLVSTRNGRVVVEDRTLQPLAAPAPPTTTGPTPGGPLADICQQFRPSMTSPATGTGMPLCTLFHTDLAGAERGCSGNGWTMGACEAGASTTPPIITPPPTTRPSSCQRYPQYASDPRNVCVLLCLPEGTYNATVRATIPPQVSYPSNEASFTVTLQMGPGTCTEPPAPPPQPPTRPPSRPDPPLPKVAFPLPLPPKETGGGMSLTKIANMTNLDCVSWEITGACMCNPTTPCVSISYWEPGWLIETVKHPGTSVFTAGMNVLQGLGVGTTAPWGAGGAANAGNGGHTNLQYNETHIYTFPQVLGGPC